MGRFILISPLPIALIVDPSAVRTSWAGMLKKVINLDQSGQKCDVAPESMIASALFCGVAMVAVDVNAKLSWVVEADAALVACFI